MNPPFWTRPWTVGPVTAAPPTNEHLGRDVWTTTLSTPLQRIETQLRLVFPLGTPRGLLLVLPVQAGRKQTYGDGLREVLATGWAARHDLLLAAPTFADSPWGVDHARDLRVRQEGYLLAVLDLLTRLLARADAPRVPRFAFGFSKAGFAAVNLLLRHPDMIDGVSVWDASLIYEREWPPQLVEVAGGPEHATTYGIPAAAGNAARWLASEPTRLALSGHGILREDLSAAHHQLTGLGIAHIHRDGPERPHRWDSGWVPEALDAITGLAPWSR
jgi:hypothetical protein